MPQVKFTPAALNDLARLRAFLRSKSPSAAKRAAKTIIKHIQILGQQPELGRPIVDMDSDYREFPIAFGNSGYVTLYRHEGEEVVILAIRHQKEVGY